MQLKLYNWVGVLPTKLHINHTREVFQIFRTYDMSLGGASVILMPKILLVKLEVIHSFLFQIVTNSFFPTIMLVLKFSIQ